MSYEYHGTTDLIALPNRTVQTYPSGLVRVERSFVCRKSDVAKHRNLIKLGDSMPLDDGLPAFDGLYIFPEPQESVRDDGFVEFRVTAYGRTNVFSQDQIEKNSVKGTFFVTNDISDLSAQQPAINETYTLRGVLQSSESAKAIIAPPNIENPLVINLLTGSIVVPIIIELGTVNINGADSESYEQTGIQILLDNFSSTNFGRWSEYVVSWVAIGFRRTYAI